MDNAMYCKIHDFKNVKSFSLNNCQIEFVVDEKLAYVFTSKT